MIGMLRGVRKTWRPSQVPNRRYAPKNKGHSSLEVEKEKESITESLSNPPAPPNHIPRRIAQERDAPQHCTNTTWKEMSGMDECDVERVKRECGVSDKTLRTHYYPGTVEEHRQENLRKASPYVQACLAKLNQIMNRRYAMKNQEHIENEKESITESLSNPPAPPNPIPRRIAQERDVPQHYTNTTWKEMSGIDDYRSTIDRVGTVASYFIQGGTDVERVKRECGVSDKSLRMLYFPGTVEERRQKNLRKASPYVQACLAKLNQITNQDDDLELLDVVSIHSSMPYGCGSGIMRYHMHFRAMPKSKAEPGHESSRLYCAVYILLCEKECHVVGCVCLENDCPGGSSVETLDKCLDAARSNAKTLGELLKLPPEVDYKELSQRARETSSAIDCVLAMKDEFCPVFLHLTKGGADVERVKREFGVSDETFERYYFPTNLEEYFQENWRNASPYIEACFAQLNQISNQPDDFELLRVPFVDDSTAYGLLRRHMHFWAMRKTMGDPGHESPGFYCAVVYVWDVEEEKCHVVGCVLLKNDCPDGAGCCNAETLAKCLDAKTLGELDAKTLGELERARESSRKREEMRRAKGERIELDEYMAFMKTQRTKRYVE